MVGARRAYLVGACSGAILLAGCVAQPGGGYAAPQGYAAQGYVPQGYAQPAPAGAAYAAQGYGYDAGPPPGQPYVGPDGLTYLDGVPVEEFGGEQVPLVFIEGQGGWGYYDRGRGWHEARPELRERLERSHPQGRGLPPPGEYGRRFEHRDFGRGGPERGRDQGREGVFRGGPDRAGGPGVAAGRGFGAGGGAPPPAGPGAGGPRFGRPGFGRPGFGEQGEFRPGPGPGGQPRPGGAPQGFGQRPGGGRPGGPQPEGQRPGGQGRPPAPSRAAPPPPPHA